MSDERLSQEEIDALLGKQKTADDGSAVDQKKDKGAAASGKEVMMSEQDEDVLGEIGNISFGTAATALSTILNQKVEITTPKVRVINRKDLESEFLVPYVSVLVDYTSGFQGSCMLVIKIKDASVIASLMMGGDGKNPNPEISEMEMSAVQEAMNQMMGSSSTALSTIFNRRIDISPPQLTLMDVRSRRGIDYIPRDEKMFEVSFRLIIGKLVDSNIMQLVPISFGKQLVKLLLSETGGNPSPQEAQKQEKTPEEKNSAPQQIKETAAAAVPEAAIDTGKKSKPEARGEKSRNVIGYVDVQPAEFSEFTQDDAGQGGSSPRNLQLLMDIPLDVSVELGRTKKTVREVLELGPGSIIELDKLAGETIDILVNDKYVAKGEVVVVDENFGIRITEILDHAERIKNL
ncbi:MAG: flagellar motor switch phosphatase FliY [Sporolactobacillus sp.]|jgi:flagellar motor switch protein FliN/FliY|nr:flagellar motor switch phosphatase FliY [Sporolactobacillus sp.]